MTKSALFFTCVIHNQAFNQSSEFFNLPPKCRLTTAPTRQSKTHCWPFSKLIQKSFLSLARFCIGFFCEFRGINVGFYMQYISVLSFSFQRCVPKIFNIYLLREAWRSGKICKILFKVITSRMKISQTHSRRKSFIFQSKLWRLFFLIRVGKMFICTINASLKYQNIYLDQWTYLIL